MKIRRFIRWAALLLAVPVLLLGIPKAASASTASAGTGWLRLAHFSPNTPAVDVYLYSFGDPSAELVLHHVGYGVASPYQSVAAGEYTVGMRLAGAADTTKPVLSASLTVAAGGAYTVAGLGPESGLRLQVLTDQLTPPAGAAGTGFGGTAPRSPSPMPWLYLIAAGLLLAAAGGLGLRLMPRQRGRHAA
jgi:hypothetical protein